MVGMFRGQLRAWFCEVAGAQSILHQDEPDYPDTGLPILQASKTHWWELPMANFSHQVAKHCHECGVPLRGYGELSQAAIGKEQTSETHKNVFKPKRVGREVEVVTDLVQLSIGRIHRTTDYIQNAAR